jgi:protoheme IX farnesyltransferase
VPHFLAIAWMHKADYARAGLLMLPVVDPAGSITGRQMVGYALALVPVSLLPALFGQAGPVYGLGAICLGVGFALAAARFVCDKSQVRARRVLHASLLYLPALLALLLIGL